MADDEPTNNGGGTIAFTQNESTLITAIMQNLTNDISFDAEAIAAQLGYKDGSVVKTRWSQIRRKKLSGGVTASGGIKKRTPKKGKAATADDDEHDLFDSPVKTPAKKAGRKPKAKKAEEAEPEDIKKEEIEDAVETTETAEGDED